MCSNEPARHQLQQQQQPPPRHQQQNNMQQPSYLPIAGSFQCFTVLVSCHPEDTATLLESTVKYKINPTAGTLPQQQQQQLLYRSCELQLSCVYLLSGSCPFDTADLPKSLPFLTGGCLTPHQHGHTHSCSAGPCIHRKRPTTIAAVWFIGPSRESQAGRGSVLLSNPLCPEHGYVLLLPSA